MARSAHAALEQLTQDRLLRQSEVLTTIWLSFGPKNMLSLTRVAGQGPRAINMTSALGRAGLLCIISRSNLMFLVDNQHFFMDVLHAFQIQASWLADCWVVAGRCVTPLK